MHPDDMRIGDLARRTEVSTRLLRYYEKQGLLHAHRDGNGYRVYRESAVKRVVMIRELLESGFTTELIRSILRCKENPHTPDEEQECATPETVETLRRQVSNIERRIGSLTRTREAVRGYLQAVEAVVDEDLVPESGRGPVKPSV
ncbi:MerR family transcriptional regulator [Streptomyces sp. NPDC056937]|uniref:MerR family transcriptional regulator n=1 Tax=Streptomyces sp. NPDC056937 TaxID=3345969 RepID=UPI003628829E